MGSSVLVIEELTGSKRRLSLIGPGLPRRGAAWGGESVIATTRFPGNPVASQQVLSAGETPSDWEGHWSTVRLLRSPCEWTPNGPGETVQLVIAKDVMEALDSLRIAAQLLRVTYTNEPEAPPDLAGLPSPIPRSLKIVRLGRLRTATFRIDTLDDIGWSATFEWASRGDAKPKLQNPSQDVLAKLRAAVVAQGKPPARDLGLSAPPDRFDMGTLDAIADAPREMFRSFARAAENLTARTNDLGNLLLKVRDTPAAIVGMAIDVTTNAIAVVNQFVDAVGRAGPETQSTQMKTTTLLAVSSFWDGAQTEADAIVDANCDIARMMARRRNAAQADTSAGGRAGAPDILAVHVPHDGETLAKISRRYYGEDLSDALARANGLDAYAVFPPRTPIIIPNRAALDTLRAV